jgi:hypothetical protein
MRDLYIVKGGYCQGTSLERHSIQLQEKFLNEGRERWRGQPMELFYEIQVLGEWKVSGKPAGETEEKVYAKKFPMRVDYKHPQLKKGIGSINGGSEIRVGEHAAIEAYIKELDDKYKPHNGVGYCFYLVSCREKDPATVTIPQHLVDSCREEFKK